MKYCTKCDFRHHLDSKCLNGTEPETNDIPSLESCQNMADILIEALDREDHDYWESQHANDVADYFEEG